MCSCDHVDTGLEYLLQGLYQQKMFNFEKIMKALVSRTSSLVPIGFIGLLGIFKNYRHPTQKTNIIFTTRIGNSLA